MDNATGARLMDNDAEAREFEPFEIENDMEDDTARKAAWNVRPWSRRHRQRVLMFACSVVGLVVVCVAALSYWYYHSSYFGLDESEFEMHDIKYKFSRLDNGLHMLVGSKKDADVGAASACLGIGYLSEPAEFAGLLSLLVHGILEHVNFTRWAMEHGGTISCSVKQTRTCISFDADSSAFVDGVHHISDAFENPNLDEAAITRNIKLLDRPFHAPWDHHGQLAIWLHDMNPAHPEHFPQGRAETLMVPGIQQKILDWFKRNFNAHDLQLAVISPQPLPELNSAVKKLFMKLPGTKDLPSQPRGPAYVGNIPPFLPGRFNGLVYRRPVGDTQMLDFYWIMSEYHGELWKTKPWMFAMKALVWEGDGGAEAYLKHKGWIKFINAEINDEATYSVFHIFIPLTDEGIDNIIEIGAVVFEYMAFLRSRSDEEIHEMLQDQKYMLDLRFQLRKFDFVFDQARALAVGMLDYPEARVISGPIKIFSVDPAANMKLLRELTPESARVMLTAPEFGDKCTEEEPLFKSKFHKEELPAPMLDAWHAAHHGTVTRMNVKELIPRNPYVPVDTSLVADPEKVYDVVSRQTFSHLKVLTYTHVKFLDPVVFCRVRIFSSSFHEVDKEAKAANFVRAWLWGTVLGLEIDKELNDLFAMPLTRYGLEFDRYWGAVDLDIKAPGSLMSIAMDKLGRMMMKPGIGATTNTSNFIRACSRIGKILKSVKREATWSFDLERLILDDIPTDQMISALEKFQKEGVHHVPEWLFQFTSVEVLMVGNILPDHAAEWSEKFVSDLRLSGPELSQSAPLRALTIQEGKTFLKVPGISDGDMSDHGLAIYIQVERELSCDNVAIFTAFLAHVVEDDWDEFSRVFGERAYFFHVWKVGQHWLEFKLETPYNPVTAMKCLHDWLEGALSKVLALNQTTFEQQKSSFLRANKDQPTEKLKQIFVKYLSDFSDRRFTFDSKDKKRKFVEASSLSDFLNFVRFSVRDARRLYLQVTKTKKGDDPEMDSLLQDALKRVTPHEAVLNYQSTMEGMEKATDGTWYSYVQAPQYQSDLTRLT